MLLWNSPEKFQRCCLFTLPKAATLMFSDSDGPCEKRSDMEILVLLGSSRFCFCFSVLFPFAETFKFYAPEHKIQRSDNTENRKYKSVGEVFTCDSVHPRMPETNAPPKVRSVGRFKAASTRANFL